MLKLVKLPSLVAKCCKIRKIYAAEVANFVYFSITHEKPYTKWQKFANFANVYFSYFATFRHQTWQFYKFEMLFLAVVGDFAFFAKMKIQFKRGIVH